jgi:hypothetical protein
MDNYEVLVHIAAPSGFRDDKRYRAQADAIVKFEAATVTNVYRGSEEAEQAGEESGIDETIASFATSLDGQSEIVKETPVQRRNRHLLSTIGGLPASSAPESASPVCWQITKGVTGNKQKPQPVPNPPYRNPLLSRRFQPSTIQAVRTPDHARPKTAPAGDIALHANNPFAGWTTRKRARSESSSFESISSVVLETQQVHNATTAVNSSGSSTQHISSSDPAVMKHIQAADDEGASQKRPRLEETSTSEKDVTIDPATATKDQTQPFFLRDRSLDWTSSPAPSSSDVTKTTSTPTATATATPSQPLPEMPRQFLSQSTPKAKGVYRYQNPTSSINLISQDLYSTPPARLPQFSSPPPPPSSPPVLISTPKSPISSLSIHIFPLPPQTGHGAYVTHITPVLAVTVNRLPVAKWFRPVHVTRDVRVLERGHWRIPITIASQAVVDEARAEMPRDQKLAKITKQRDAPTSKERWEKRRMLEAARTERRDVGLSSSPLEYGEDGEFVERKRQDFWTQEEFVGFWGTLEECVGQGKWGWGVRVFREELTENGDGRRDKQRGGLPSSSPGGEAVRAVGAEGEGERRVLLKVTTWGEVIPHIWILLWLMSDKLTAYIPMEWRAGDDSVVVKMSGYRRKHGVLGKWVYKGPAGEKGIWGIAEADATGDGEAGKA